MSKQRKLIIFFIPPEKFVGGGILSIFSLCSTSREFRSIHESEVLLCTYPGHPTYGKNDLFENDEIIYSFDEVIENGPIESLLLHVPEYASREVLDALEPYKSTLGRIARLGVNILNQNILMMPEPTEAACWFNLTPHLTQTTAHDKYSTQVIADKFGIPTHHLSTFVDARQYKVRSFDEKENIILLSPDKHPMREKIAHKLKLECKDYKIITVQDMLYEDYKELVSKAKFTITFGEGFDGYFVEAHFTGGIGIAVYNEDFFPDKSFSSFSNVYVDYDALLSNITQDIATLSTNQRNYRKVSQQSLDAINKLYSYKMYRQNLRNFYEGRFSFVPSENAQKRLLGITAEENYGRARELAILEQRLIHDTAELRNKLEEQEVIAKNENAKRTELEDILSNTRNSLSWRITEPLRKLNSLRK